MIWSDIDLEITFNDLMANVHAESKPRVIRSRLLILWLESEKFQHISKLVVMIFFNKGVK